MLERRGCESSHEGAHEGGCLIPVASTANLRTQAQRNTVGRILDCVQCAAGHESEGRASASNATLGLHSA